MIAQIGDIYKFEDKNYDIVAFSSPIEFDPTTYGITPAALQTACWAGAIGSNIISRKTDSK